MSVLIRLRLGQVETARKDLDGLLAIKNPSPDVTLLLAEATALSESLSRARR